MTKEQIKNIVRETISEMLRAGVLPKYDSSAAYSEAVRRIKEFYANGETDIEMAKALKCTDGDPYAALIPLYFEYGYTLERLAEQYNVEVSTITRNKKRLCLMVFDALQ